MDARISFRGWVLLFTIVFCIAVWWWLLTTLFAARTDRVCQTKRPSAPEICQRPLHAR